MKRTRPCRNYRTTEMTRRSMLRDAACGFGSVALAGLLAESSQSLSVLDKNTQRASAHFSSPHIRPKAKRVVFLYMDGGPSQVDSFDPKPRLDQEHGKPFKMKIEPTQFNNIGTTLKSPWRFRKYGECGAPVSELFPNIAKHVDDIAFIRSMTSQFSEHSRANYFLHTGSGLQGRPSMGAWFGYGLGCESQNLPGFVVLNGGLIPPGGLDCFNSGFLPATFQGSVLNPEKKLVANIRPLENVKGLQQKKLALLNRLDQRSLHEKGPNDDIESAIANYELAYQMQSAVPELADLSSESINTRSMYGLESNNPKQALYGKQCLLARRLLERGVRFIELTCPNIGHDRWDQHSNLFEGHRDNALIVDQAIGALLTDLKQRGLLDDTLVVWSGEFGRTPFAQGKNGRDHNPFGFTLWMAGGGIKGGVTHGVTDEFGYKAIEGRQEIHDLHATMLYLLGVDHERLTFRWSGRDMRLTDVHGKVIHEIIA